jgi:hypothetical protein
MNSLLSRFGKQTEIVEAICLASQTFRLTPLDDYNLIEPDSYLKPRSQSEKRGFPFHMGMALAFCPDIPKGSLKIAVVEC